MQYNKNTPSGGAFDDIYILTKKQEPGVQQSFRVVIDKPVKRSIGGNFKKAFKKMLRKAVRALSKKSYEINPANRAVFAFGGALLMVAVLVYVFAFNFSIGYKINIGDNRIGIARDVSSAKQMFSDINAHIADAFGEDCMIEGEMSASICIVKKGNYTSDEDFKSAVFALSDDMREMNVIYADDAPLLAVATAAEAEEVTEKFKDYYTNGNSDVEFSTSESISIKQEEAPISILCDVDTAVSKLTGEAGQEDSKYVVKKGDTYWSIAEDHGMSAEDLMAINHTGNDSIAYGDVIYIKAAEPLVAVTTTEQVVYTKTLDYKTTVAYSNEMYEGTSKITTKGSNGTVKVTANVTKENGVEIKNDVLYEEVVTAPVNEVKVIGTKERPSGLGTGKFSVPVSGYRVSSHFGYRKSGYHKGVDMAVPTGTAVRASDNGIIIFSGWSGSGFGYLVKIDHQNGYISYYAHNSRVAVKKGETVSKGDVIAYSGSTGNSTGPHVHFELYKNGTLQNPENYLSL